MPDDDNTDEAVARASLTTEDDQHGKDVVAAIEARHEKVSSRHRIYGISVSLLVMLASLFVAANLILTTTTLWQVSKNSEKNRVGVERLIDCTTPGGECYERGQRSTGESVSTINRVTLHAVYCATVLPKPTRVTLRACVEDQLRKDKP